MKQTTKPNDDMEVLWALLSTEQRVRIGGRIWRGHAWAFFWGALLGALAGWHLL